MDDEPPSRRNALIAIVVIVALVAGGFWIAQVLHKAGQTEDCLMRGGRNCAPIDATKPR